MFPSWAVNVGPFGRNTEIPQSYQRTRVLGFSVVHESWTAFRASARRPDRWELRWYSGGSIDHWADSSDIAWTYSGDPVNTGGLIDPVGGVDDETAVDRVILVISGLSSALHPPGGFSSNVSEWQGYISSAITNIRARHPNVKSILLQPNVGGPGGSTCPDLTGSTNSPTGDIRCTFTEPYIHSACSALVGGIVRLGHIPFAGSCTVFSDWAGHMTTGGYALTGAAMAAYYNDNS